MSDGLAAPGFWGDADGAEALQRYQALVTAVDDGIYQLDAGGRFVAVNEAIVEATGYSRDELLGEHVSRLLAPEDVERIERAIGDRLSADGTDVGTFEVTIEAADGERVPFEVRVTLLVEDGTFSGTVGVARELPDGTGRREAPVFNDTITTLLDEADVGVFVLDEAFDVVWADATVARYFGFDRADAVGRDKRELIEESIADRVADGEAFADIVLGTYEDNSSVERFQCRVTHGDGERWLEHRSRPIESGRYAGGRIELYYDVTDRHRHVSQLKRLNEAVNDWLEESSHDAVARQASGHLRTILDMEINGIYRYDPETDALRPASWTERAEALFGDLPVFERGEGIAWRVFESGQPEVYDDVSEVPGAYDPDTPARSEIVLPIGDHGVAIIGSEQPGEFDDGDLTLAKVVASSLEATFDRLDRERDLRRERDLIDEIIEATPVGTLVRDADGKLTRMNERAAALFDVDDPAEYSPPDRPMYDESDERIPTEEYPFARALATGEPVSDRVVQVERSDGDRRWLSIDAVPLTDESGDVDRIVTTGEDVTDLKERERTLESELSEVFGRVSDAFYAVDEEYRFTHLNERAASFLGYDGDEVLGRRLEDVFSEMEEVERIRAAVDEAMDTQEPVTLDHYSPPVESWFEARIYPSESGVSVYFRDVTERKERERELEQYERILETIDDGVYVLDADSRFLTVNGAFADMLGRDRDDLLGEPASTAFADEKVDRAERLQRELIEGETDIAELEEHVEAADGPVPVVTRFALFEIDGEFGRVGVVRDVTERRERERELEQSERRYRTLAEHFPGVVTLFDRDLRYELAAGRGFEDVSVDPDDVEGHHVRDAWNEATADALEPRLEAALSGEDCTFDLEHEGREWILRVVPVTDERGDVFAGMTVAQDISERKEYERQLEASNERLEQFAYAASHDLQEPLRMVSSYLRLIESRYADELDQDGREFLEFAVDGADRMRDMIEGLLEYSRVETRGEPFEPVDLDDVLADARRDLQMKVAESDAEISAESLPTVEGDGDQLRQVFQNLLDNAIEYSGDAPPRVRVDAERAGDQWVISVSDEGIGIDADDADRVFEVFQRLHTRDEHEGTGIGLALCRRIVERHGGAIRVESDASDGTTFSFTLPATEGQ
ncbi:PAS domain-containing protein [Halomicrobium urmianum]|uniref:PAS domain-containing protein n=1 Tax=Halomicrobium urmianum TaxID=1586233 RepID=UPI001CD9C0BF|nr:PAS domain-containing protein [Halomicrobium urmianum]